MSFIKIGVTGISGGGKSTVARAISFLFEELWNLQLGYIEHDDLYHDRKVIFGMQGIQHDPVKDPDETKALSQVVWDSLSNINFPGTLDTLVEAESGKVNIPIYRKKQGDHVPRSEPIYTKSGLVMEGLFMLSSGFSDSKLYNPKTCEYIDPEEMSKLIEGAFDYKILICCEERDVAYERRKQRDAHMNRPLKQTERLIQQADEFYENYVLALEEKNPDFFEARIICDSSQTCVNGIYEFLQLVAKDHNLNLPSEAVVMESILRNYELAMSYTK